MNEWCLTLIYSYSTPRSDSNCASRISSGSGFLFAQWKWHWLHLSVEVIYLDIIQWICLLANVFLRGMYIPFVVTQQLSCNDNRLQNLTLGRKLLLWQFTDWSFVSRNTSELQRHCILFLCYSVDTYTACDHFLECLLKVTSLFFYNYWKLWEVSCSSMEAGMEKIWSLHLQSWSFHWVEWVFIEWNEHWVEWEHVVFCLTACSETYLWRMVWPHACMTHFRHVILSQSNL